jgi:hypothetical protein
MLDMWIDGNDVDIEGTWVLSDGEPMTYTYWHKNNPDNYLGIQDCVGIWRDTFNTHVMDMDDWECSALLFYICEIGKFNNLIGHLQCNGIFFLRSVMI